MTNIDITQSPYNADNGGTIISAGAITSARDNLLSSSRGGILYAPTGGYAYDVPINFSLTSGQSLMLDGDGAGASIYKSVVGGAGFNINFLSGNLVAGRVSAEGLTFKTTVPNGGNGLTLTSNNVSNPGPVKELTDLVFCGVNGGYWTYGLTLDGCTFTNISRTRFNGDENGSGIISGGGVNIKNSQSTHAVDYHFSDCYFWQNDLGVNAGPGVEGLYFSNTTMVAVNQGVRWMNGSNSGLPLLQYMGGHINSQQYGILTEGIVQVTIAGTLFYRNMDNGGSPWAAIYLDNNVSSGSSDANQIDHVTIMGFGNPAQSNGIVLRNCCGTVIDTPRIDNCQTAIWLQPGSNGNTIIRPNITNCPTKILDQGIGNIAI